MKQAMDKKIIEPEENVCNWAGLSAGGSNLNGLLPSLQRLDLLLRSAVALSGVAYGAKAVADPYRGLYINREEVEELLTRNPGAPLLWCGGENTEDSAAPPHAGSSRIAWLKEVFDLSPFDLDVIIVALAPEVDLRYERLYAFLQDNVSKRRPSVALALHLLCPDAETKLLRRTHFAADAPLIWHRLVHLIPVSLQKDPLLAHIIKLDEQILDLLLGHDRLDSRLAPFCHMVEPTATLEHLPLNVESKEMVTQLVVQACEEDKPLRLHFHGQRGMGKRRAAEALAGVAGMPLLVADMMEAAPDREFGELLQVLFRAAWFRGAMLLIDHLDLLKGNNTGTVYEALLDQLAAAEGVVIMAGGEPWVSDGRHPIGVITVPFPVPAAARRRILWQAHLEASGLTLKTEDMDALAGRFRLTPAQIDEAFAVAMNRIPRRAAGDSAGQFSDQPVGELFVAIRAQCGQELSRLARKITPVYTWKDIVLPEEAMSQLREICQRVSHQHQVLDEWGFGQKLSQGKGVNALFVGPSGTGKTMAAEIIANELQLDLYKVDLSGVVSKYIGETEKNLDRIFRAAEDANAILFFDEADALFGKRSEVRDSHDRYASNIEISYLLQKMEQFEGITILATNLRQNLDEAFVRRLAFTVHFPFPNEADRRRIWDGIWPTAVPRAEDLDLEFLARQFKLTGGNIKNIALAAAFLAADNGTVVTKAHLLHATRREYQKLGKALSEAELSGACDQQPIGNRV
jgi:AAA+ superfamily predicted ATPase